MAGRPRRRAALLDEARHTTGFGLEQVEDGTNRLVRHSMLLEIIRDQVISGPSRCKRARAVLREASVIDESRALRGLDSLAPDRRSRTLVGESLLERSDRMVARSQSPQRLRFGLEPAKSPSERPRGRTIERAPNREAGRVNGLERHDAPPATVEIDLDPCASASPKRRDNRWATVDGQRAHGSEGRFDSTYAST